MIRRRPASIARLAILAGATALLAGACDAAPTASQSAAPAAPAPTRPVPSGHARMLGELRAIRERARFDNIYQCDAQVEELERQLKALPPDAPPIRRFRILFELGDIVVLLGREREGIALLTQAYDLRPAVRGTAQPQVLEELVLRLGAAWMRVGETENCCAMNSPGSCILPLEGEALHGRPEGSTKSKAYFRELLDDASASAFAKFQAMWLLNVVSMTLGEYPDAVPEAYRVPPSYLAADEDFPRFRNVAKALAVDTFGLAGGAVADDFDGDGDLDFFVSDMDPAAQLRYFRNTGAGGFEDATEAAGLAGLLGGLNLNHADYDNDGRPDLLVLRGAWLGRNGRHPNSLLHNDGDGKFTDRAYEAGLAGVDFPTQTAAWADIDNDGDLDLFVGNESGQGLDAPCQLFRNEGDGTFTDVGAAAGVTNGGFTKGVVAGDFDGDRLPDFYVSNLGQPNRLYRNRGDGTFEDVAPARGVTLPTKGFPAFAWDYDNDGALDVLALPFYVTIADLAAASRGDVTGADTPHLYRGDGRGGFQDVSAAARVAKPCSPMGCNFGDLDNDGFLDVYLGTGTPTTRAVMPNLVWLSRGGRDFADVSLPSGMAHLQKGHGVAFADFDDDGDLDVLEDMGGAYRGDKFANALYESPGFPGTHWLAVRCIGTKSNRSAIGARIRAEIVDGGTRRSVFRTVGTGGSFGGNPLRQHLGLGQATKVETLEVFWPATGETQTFRDVAVDRLVEVTEGKTEIVSRTLTARRLGGDR